LNSPTSSIEPSRRWLPRGQTPDTLLTQWIEDLRDRDRDPHYFETNEWFRHLGVSDAVIEEVWREVRAEAETVDYHASMAREI